MLYLMMIYDTAAEFNKDAEQRNRYVKTEGTTPGERLWWKVEQVVQLTDLTLLVVWSRPEPFKHTHTL